VLNEGAGDYSFRPVDSELDECKRDPLVALLDDARLAENNFLRYEVMREAASFTCHEAPPIFWFRGLWTGVGNKSRLRPVVRFGKDRRHGLSSVHAPNGFRWDCRTAAINSRTRLRRASTRSTNRKSVSRSTHSGGTSPAIAHRVVSGKDSIRLNHGSNDCHPPTS